MKKASLFFLAIAAAFSLFAQPKPTPPHFDADAPAWAKMLLAENPNVFEVQQAYRSHFAERPFEKNRYTQFYKRWMRWARPFTQANGSLQLPENEELAAAERQILQQRISPPASHQSPVTNHQSRAATWTFNGPKVHFFPDASAQSVDHTNIYSFDIYAADPSILYAGGESGGVWKTTDKGLNWTLLTADVLHGAFGAVKISPDNPDVVFACTSGKIIKTTDGGATWATVYNENNLWVNELWIHDGTAGIVLAASDKGLLRSMDGGANWSKVFPQNTWTVKNKPGDPNTVWVIRQNGASSDFMVSTDAGASFLPSNNGWWQPTGNRQVTGAIIAPCTSKPEKVYAFLSGEGTDLGGYIGVFVSEDGGANWMNTHPGNAIGQPYAIPSHTNLMDANGVDWFWQGFYDQAIVVNPLNDNQLIAGGCSWFRSNDGGKTWFGYGGYVASPLGAGGGDRHPDIQWAAAVGSEVWIASDGGLVYSTNFGETVEGRNNGISGADLWGFGSGWNEDILVGGRYHNGNMAYHESFPPGSFYAIGGAEAATGYVNPSAERKVYHSDIGGHRIVPGFGNGIEGFPVGMFPNENYAYFANSEMEWHPACWNLIFLGKHDKLWRSQDGGATFTVLHDFPGSIDREVYDIEISRANPDVLYVSQWNGTDDVVWRSTDGGATWTACTPLPKPNNNDRLKLAASSEDAQVLWLSVSYGSDGKKIYKTSDGGATWQNLTTPLLDGVQISNIMAQYGTDGGIYLGTNQGVFYRNNSMSDWQPYSEGLPVSAQTNRLKPFYKKGLLRNGCWGFGIWEAPLFEASNVVPQAMCDKLESFCLLDTFYFDDHSVVHHDGASWSWQFTGTQAVLGENTRTPRVVFASPGVQKAFMTLTTPQGIFRDTLTVLVGDQCTNLLPEAVPGNALSLDGNGDYASLSEPLNLNSNAATITCWMKPVGDQADWAGVVLCRGGSTTAGIHFGENNQLRYMWNDENWWWDSGVFPPLGEWSHVALVIEPNKATLYLNGIPTSLNTSHGIEEFNAPLVFGRDPGWDNRFFKGLLEEICFYDHALTQDQIRLEMHLTRTHTDTTGLRHYFQFNENEGFAFDRVGLGYASFGGDAHRVVSTVAVGGGTSDKQQVEAGGEYVFGQTGFTLNFPDFGIYPNGELVATRLNLAPDASPGGTDSLSRSYWVLHNFGDSPLFDEPSSLIFSQVGNVPPGTSPAQYQLFTRPPTADGDTWQLLAAATQITPGIDGSVVFSENNNVEQHGQFVLTRPLPVATQEPVRGKFLVEISPNPVASDGSLRIRTNLSGRVVFRLFNEKGRAVRVLGFEREGVVKLEGLAAGGYVYSVENEAVMKFGKVVVE